MLPDQLVHVCDTPPSLSEVEHDGRANEEEQFEIYDMKLETCLLRS